MTTTMNTNTLALDEKSLDTLRRIRLVEVLYDGSASWSETFYRVMLASSDEVIDALHTGKLRSRQHLRVCK